MASAIVKIAAPTLTIIIILAFMASFSNNFRPYPSIINIPGTQQAPSAPKQNAQSYAESIIAMNKPPAPNHIPESLLKPSVITAKDTILAFAKLQFLYNIETHERRIYSQNGEDGVIEYLFDNMGTSDKYYVEFGTEHGNQCNTRHLYREYQWTGLLMDGSGVITSAEENGADDTRVIQNHFIRADTIVSLFQTHNVPHNRNFDLLSVDLDANDYFVLKAILEAGYTPNVIILEINRNFGPLDSYTRSLDENRRWTGGRSTYMGHSPKASQHLANKHGYHMIYYDKLGVNGFYVKLTYVQSYLKRVTGLVYPLDEIKTLLPTFEYVYRRQPVLHQTSMNRFREQFEDDPWVGVTEDLKIAPKIPGKRMNEMTENR
jgi:hypothetical protein